MVSIAVLRIPAIQALATPHPSFEELYFRFQGGNPMITDVDFCAFVSEVLEKHDD